MIDPLDILNSLSTEELASTDTSFPNLSPSQYEFLIDEATIEGKDDGSSKYLLFKTKLNSEGASSTAGEPLAPGYPVRHMVNLMPSQKQLDKHGEEQCIKNIKKDIAKFLQAVMGPSCQWDPTLEIYRGQTFFATTRVSKERTDPNTGITYDPQTEFSKFIPRETDVDAATVAAAYAEKAPF